MKTLTDDLAHQVSESEVLQLAPQRERSGSDSSLTSITTAPSPRDLTMGDESEAMTPLNTLLEQDRMEIDDEMARPARQSATANGTHLAVTQSLRNPSLKRSSAEAELAPNEDDHVLAAKKQKFHATAVKELRPNELYDESHERSTSQPTRTLRHGHLSQQVAQPTIKLRVNGRSGGPVVSKAASDGAGSPLSDLSSPPPSQPGTPRIVTMPNKGMKKKAKTKQS